MLQNFKERIILLISVADTILQGERKKDNSLSEDHGQLKAIRNTEKKEAGRNDSHDQPLYKTNGNHIAKPSAQSTWKTIEIGFDLKGPGVFCPVFLINRNKR